MDDPIVVSAVDDQPSYASRGGHKLAGALAVFGPAGLVVTGRRCLDAGASTGGFTDVLLRSGAASVVCRRRRVRAARLAATTGPAGGGDGPHERPSAAPWRSGLGSGPSLVVADLSFISLALVLAPLVVVATPGADFVLMVKPQFEVGRDRVGDGRGRPRPGVARRGGGYDRGAGVRPWSRRPGRHGQPVAGAGRERGVLPLAAVRGAGARPARAEPRDRGGPVVSDGRRRRPLGPAGHAPGREQASETARTTARALLAAGIEVRVPEAEESGLGVPGVVPVAPVQGAAKGCELVVVVGGDGTILRGAELARGTGAALLGVNLGHVGFLAEAEPEDADVGGRPAHRPRLRRRGAPHARGGGAARRRRARAHVGGQRGQRREALARTAASSWSSRSTAVRCRAGAATAWCARHRRGRRRTRSRPAVRSSGQRSRLC